MPIYEYACTCCDYAFDELQKVSDAALVHCPSCNEPALRKKLSAPKFRLKGEGWYETDFKTGDKRNLVGEADKKPEEKTESGSKKETAVADKKPSAAKTVDASDSP